MVKNNYILQVGRTRPTLICSSAVPWTVPCLHREIIPFTDDEVQGVLNRLWNLKSYGYSRPKKAPDMVVCLFGGKHTIEKM